MYKTDKTVFTTSTAPEGGTTVKPVSLSLASDDAWEIPNGETATTISSNIDSTKEIEYVAEYLRFMILLMGLPPELLDNRSRAETGAAKEVDFDPIWQAAERDRERASLWLVDFGEWMRPAFEAFGLVDSGSRLDLFALSPKQPVPTNLQSWAQGMDGAAKLGLVSLIREVASRSRIPLGDAKARWKENLKEYRDATGGPNGRVPVQMDAEETGPEKT
jgi:hypothetical protein